MASAQRIYVSRAQRFPLQMPMSYRKPGMLSWHEARTLNISRTGILFSTDESLEPDSPLEIHLKFPANVTVSCQGSIVRSEESAFALRIHRYRLTPI